MPASTQLSERQTSILTLIAQGKTNQQIADTLYLSQNTVKWYLQQIYQELGARNRVQAVRLAREQGLLITSSVEAVANQNLPAANTPFRGREKRLGELKAMILQPQPRLISICGLGGVGKTRLAIEAARSAADTFDDGVFFIPLEAIESRDEFWHQCLIHLQIPRISNTPERDLVREYLRDRRTLLILDNTEYLPHIQSEIGRLLTQSNRLQVVSTSRVRLNLQAEHFYPLDGLDYQAGTDSPAYQLFLDVARRHHPGFEPSPAEQQEILAFCEAVEGLPLAIELAATWMDVMGPDELVTQLRSSLDQMRHDAQDRPARQRSLQAVVDYSWQFLSEEESLALARLSPMRGSFSREAAVKIGQCTPATLKKLVHGSLIMATADGRYKIHALIRQYGQERAGSIGLALDDLREQHMAYYLGWLVEASREVRIMMRAVMVARIRDEWHQLEVAWWRAVERGRWELLEACIDVTMYFEARGIWGEGMAFFSQTQRAIPADYRRLHVRLDEAMSIMAIRMYHMSEAQDLANRALAKLNELDEANDGAGVYAQITLATIAYVEGGHEALTKFLAELSDVADDYLVKFSEFRAAMFAGIDSNARKEYAAGVKHFSDVLAMSDEDAYYLPAIQCMLALSYVGLREYDAAQEHFAEALDRGLEISSYPAVVTAIYELDRLDHPERSESDRWLLMMDNARELNSLPTTGRMVIGNGATYLSMGFYKRARNMFRMGLQMLRGRTSNQEMVSLSVIIMRFRLYEFMHRRRMAKLRAGSTD